MKPQRIKRGTIRPKARKTARKSIIPTKGIKRAPKAQNKPKKSKISLWREWNVPDWAYHRYEGMKGIYWFWFSRTIRERDYERYSGKCMTCGFYVEKGSDQAGHLFAARNCGFGLLFHPKNVHLQHSKCNNPRFTPDAAAFNALAINKRYGEGTVETLAKIKGIKTKEWSRQEYEKQIKLLPAYQQSLL